MDLSIIIPTYNEAKRIGKTLDTLSQFLKTKAKNHHVEVIVADLSSPDGTAEVVQRHTRDFEHLSIVTVTRPPGKVMKGRQVAVGVAKARGRYVMFMDADLATPLKYLDNVFALMEHDQPIGICVRNLSQSHKGIRKLVSNLGNVIVRTLLTPGIPDTQCGFKAFRADVADQIFSQQRIVGWGFDMEALALARRYHYPVSLIEVPDWHDVAGSKIAGGSALSAAIKILPDLVKIKWGMWTGKYKPAKRSRNREAVS